VTVSALIFYKHMNADCYNDQLGNLNEGFSMFWTEFTETKLWFYRSAYGNTLWTTWSLCKKFSAYQPI